MNVRPGHMAIIVRDTMAQQGRETCFSNLIGTPLMMGEHIDTFMGHKVWSYQGATLRCRGCRFPFPVLLESDLQGIGGSTATSKTSTPTTLPTAAPHRDLVTQ